MRIEDALRVAADADLDLVEVAPLAKPPVCKIMDYGKFKYETAQKERESRKNQQQTVVKEQKLRPKIDDHDYLTKKGHVIRFLQAGSKVKVTIMFRGREVTHPERGTAILDRLAEELADLGVVEQRPMQEGRNMTMMMAPSKAVLAGRIAADGTVTAATDEHAVLAGGEAAVEAAGEVAVAPEPPAENGGVQDAAEAAVAPEPPVENGGAATAGEVAGEVAVAPEPPAENGGTAAAGTPVS